MSRLSKQTAILLGLQMANGAAVADDAVFSAFDGYSSGDTKLDQDDPDLAGSGIWVQKSDGEEVFGTSSSGFAAPNYIFTTLSSGVGDLSQWPQAGGAAGIDAGDAICQVEAAAAGLPGANEYIAWLSDTQSDAYCRAHGLGDTMDNNCGQASLPSNAGPWRRLDGRRLGGRLPDMLDQGALSRPIQFSPNTNVPGTFLNRLTSAYTGTTASGFLSTNNHCSDWSVGDNQERASQGISDTFTPNWAGANSFPGCGSQLPLVCLRPGSFSNEPEPSAPAISRRVFVTSSTGTGDLSSWADSQGAQGVDAGDNICQAHAQRAGLDNSEGYRAWLSDPTVSAIGRLLTDGPLLNQSGDRVAFSLQDFVQTFHEATLSIDENGAALPMFSRVWTGTADDGTSIPGADCNSWQSADPLVSGLFGRPGLFLDRWSSNATDNCNAEYRLYCVADFEGDITFGTGFEALETFTPPD